MCMLLLFCPLSLHDRIECMLLLLLFYEFDLRHDKMIAVSM